LDHPPKLSAVSPAPSGAKYVRMGSGSQTRMGRARLGGSQLHSDQAVLQCDLTRPAAMIRGPAAKARALGLAIRAAHSKNRFAAMNICGSMVSSIRDEAVGFCLASVLLTCGMPGAEFNAFSTLPLSYGEIVMWPWPRPVTHAPLPGSGPVGALLAQTPWLCRNLPRAKQKPTTRAG
jgi:hypothetical protein